MQTLLINLHNSGDSYSQTGFDPTLSLPSSSNPLGNPTFPGYTTSGGPNWIGYYITQYNSSPVYSYNFASGGATTDAKLVTPVASTVLSFVDQVNLYLKSSKTAGFTKWNAANSILAVWIGVNVITVVIALSIHLLTIDPGCRQLMVLTKLYDSPGTDHGPVHQSNPDSVQLRSPAIPFPDCAANSVHSKRPGRWRL
jgi:hypothetical protein